jgi:serine protease AprX
MRAVCLGALLLAALLLLPLAPAAATQRVVVQLRHAPDAEERAALLAHGVPTFLAILPAAIGDVRPDDLGWLRAQPWVERVDPDQPLERHLDRSKPLVRAGRPMLDLGFDGAGVGVAILDSGIDATHPDFAGRVAADVTYVNGDWQPTRVDTDGHGTHVAGVVAGDGSASGGVLAGVAPGATLVGMDFTRSFTTTTALQAFDWVLRHARESNIRVVTNSWGRAESPNAWDPGDSLVRASNRLVQEGIVVLFSAGNKGPDASTVTLEGQNPDVITVGAVDDAARIAGFSGRGPVRDGAGQAQDWVKPDLVADGVSILSARSAQATGPIQQPLLQPSQLPGLGTPVGQEGARYTELSGTSQAAPHVAGIVAAMLQANPALTPGQVHNLLRESAIDLGPPGPDADTGFGLVDARDAVHRALGQPADRGNILLTGGEETYAAAGSLAAAANQLVQTSPVLQVKSGGVVEASFPVKVGATSARFDFAWQPTAAAFRVYLAGPAQTLGPWTSSRLEGGERVVSGRADDIAPGVYHLIARPGAPVDAQYRATMTVSVREQAQLPAKLEERYRAPEQLGPLEQVGGELRYELDKAGQALRRAVPGPEPLLALAALAAVGLARRR